MPEIAERLPDVDIKDLRNTVYKMVGVKDDQKNDVSRMLAYNYTAELTDEQARWYSKAGSDEERDDIAIRLGVFYFPSKVGLRCYKHKNGSWFLETDGLRCNIKYKMD